MTLLKNLRVLDFSRYIAGPYCASILADLGAEVIRVEPVGGGEDRKLISLPAEADGALFLQLHRNKKSLAIDAASPAGRSAIQRLIATADVVVTNLPVEALKRQGLDYGTLRTLRADIIAVNLSAFGSCGRLAAKSGFDAVAQGVSGAAYLSGTPQRPARSASSYVDYGTGLAAALGALAAIMHRMATGEGQDVQASLLATAMTFINAAHIEAASTGTDRPPFDNRSPFSGPSDFVPTRDGMIAVQVVGMPMFRRWARLVGRPELADDQRYETDADRGARGHELSGIMADWSRQRTSAEAIEELEQAGIPAGPILTPLQAATHPDILESGIVTPEGLPVASLLVQLSGLAAPAMARAPGIGEHTVETLRSAGLTEVEIALLRTSGAVAGSASEPG